jgi:hypothetical protein
MAAHLELKHVEAQPPSSFGADGEKCAVKSFKKHGLSEKRRGDLKNEARQLLGLEDFGGLWVCCFFSKETGILIIREYNRFSDKPKLNDPQDWE